MTAPLLALVPPSAIEDDDRRWWDSLRHFGLLLAPTQVAELEQEKLEPLPRHLEWQLRRQLNRFEAGELRPGAWIAWLLESVAGFGPDASRSWLRGSDVPAELSHTLVTGQRLRPRQLWTGPQGFELPVFFDDNPRVGQGRGRKVLSDALQWLRTERFSGSGTPPFALLTNGRQLRLLYAGPDFDASCEWDTGLWFESGEPGPQIEALRRVLTPALLALPADDAASPLLELVQASRRGQAELSSGLGERVREAVEELVRAHGSILDPEALQAGQADIYRAAVRLVMRLVVVLFAESRDLLPRSIPVYQDCYGLQGLLEELERVHARGGSARLGHRYGAWPRVLALFRLLHEGSHHEALPIPRYGGELFEPGRTDENASPLQRSVEFFETACFGTQQVMPDSVVHRMLERLTRTSIRVRQGRTSTRTVVPVDFSDLSTEYIGILYEGLLDYELRAAPADDPVVFLAAGDQPALPLSRLEAMEDRQLRDFFKELRKKPSSTSTEEELAEMEEMEEEDEDEAGDGDDDVDVDVDLDLDTALAAEPEGDTDDRAEAARARILKWSRRVVGLIKKPQGRMTPEKELAHEREIEVAARTIVSRWVHPGGWYLVRWGGTRKGSGSYYTRPQLTVPTVRRVLRPLAFEAQGSDSGNGEDADKAPRPPEEILALQVCDPACGSGSFLVAALRYLTDTLYASLFHHGRLKAQEDRTLVHLLDPKREEGGDHLSEEFLPCRVDADDFEPRLKARLRRHVVERCLYGVDLDPLAVELCRLALWIETLDRELPFSFLRHKVKTGNSLIGAWFDQVAHYPAMAWKNRGGGDEGHGNGVHFGKGERTKALKDFCGNLNVKGTNTVRGDLAAFLTGRTLFSEDQLDDSIAIHDQARNVFGELHALPVHDVAERARLYDELVSGNDWQATKARFDLWCACWFWPADELASAPLPSRFADPRPGSLEIARSLAQKNLFFHWELEFPDVFDRQGAGFDAILGNPPWDIAKPNSKEFYSNIDPLYRSYGKQEALRSQHGHFADDRHVEEDWLDYSATFKAQSNFFRHKAQPWGDPATTEKSGERFSLARGRANKDLHERWREARARTQGYSDPRHAFRHQGSADVNLYKLFLEAGHALLRKEGRLGLVVPSGLYSDLGTGPLRRLFFDECRWEWLFGFENREKIFDIHRSFKFNLVLIAKGGRTEAIRTAFMRHKLEDWQEAERHATTYPRDRVARWSPISRSILEIQSSRDLEILEKIYSDSVLFSDKSPDGWGIEYAAEFHGTNDSHLFPPRPKWEADGYKPDEYSRWLKGNWQPRTRLCPAPPGCRRVEIPEGVILSQNGEEWIREDGIDDLALPLYEGRMIGQFDFSQKGWRSGKGRSAVWDEWEWDRPRFLSPQYLMGLADYEGCVHKVGKRAGEPKTVRGLKAPLLAVTSGTNTRTAHAGLQNDMPCNNSLSALRARDDQRTLVAMAALNSFVVDWEVRLRLVGLSLSFFVLNEVALPRPRVSSLSAVASIAAGLSAGSTGFARLWSALPEYRSERAWRACWRLARSERLRSRAILDAVFAFEMGLEFEDLAYILRGTDEVDPTGGEPKGFWRVGRKDPPELRHPVLAQVAFADLQRLRREHGDDDRAIHAFLHQNDGQGWLLPEELRLADYDLGHDERARRPQPVAERLGPRFFDWQLEQEPEESWQECELHARNLAGPKGLSSSPGGSEKPEDGSASSPSEEADGQETLF